MGPWSPRCPCQRRCPPCPHTPFSHGPFDTELALPVASWLHIQHEEPGPGSAGWVGSPLWVWAGSLGGAREGRAWAGPFLLPLGGLLSSPRLPLPPGPWACLWRRGCTAGPGPQHTDPGTLLGQGCRRSAGRRSDLWSLQAWLGKDGEQEGSRVSGSQGCPPRRSTFSLARLPEGSEPVGVDRAQAVGWEPVAGPGLGCTPGRGGQLMLSHFEQTNGRCHPRGPGPTLGNHQSRFSHGFCPLSGPLLSPRRALGALPYPHLQLEKPVLCTHPFSALHSESAGKPLLHLGRPPPLPHPPTPHPPSPGPATLL